MYDLNALQQETTCNDENSYEVVNNWPNIQQNDVWSNNTYLSKSQYDRTEFNDLTNTNYTFNNSTYNSYFNQSYVHSSKQNYYGFQSSVVAPALTNTDNQLTYTNQYNYDNTNVQPIVKNDQSDDSTNTSRTSPLEQVSIEKLVDSPISNESIDKISKNNTSYDSNKENNDDSTNTVNNNIPTYLTTQKIVNNTVKLSYTAYQLELLNAIYTDMKYPNSVQKTLIAKLIGITRDQVKIWFQNRRRKDTLVSQGKMTPSLPNVLKSDSKKRRRSSDESENNEEDIFPSSPELLNSAKKKQVVENQVIQNVLFQLRSHQNAPSRLSSKRTKTNNSEQTDDLIKQIPISKPVDNLSTLPVITNKIQPEELKYQSSSTDYNINNNQALTPSSLSSFSSSSSSSATSSEEDNSAVNYVQQKYQTLSQPFSVKDYVDTRYMSNYYKQPKVHNQQYQFNKLNPWANPSQINFNSVSTETYSSTQPQNENVYRQYQVNNYELASNYMPKYHASAQSDLYNQAHPTPQVNYQFLANNTYNYC